MQKRADRDGPAQRQAGHRRHPDARVDDRELPPDPRRGLRRRQRRARRRRRGDALRRDQRRRVPDRGGRDDGADHRVAPRTTASTAWPPRWAPSRTPTAASIAKAAGRGRRAASARSTSSPSPSPATPPAGWRASAARIPMLAFTPDAADPLAAGADLGRRDVPGRRRSSTPTRWSRQVDEALLEIGRVRRGRHGRHRRRLAPRHPRLHQRPARPPRWATPSTRSPRRTRTSTPPSPGPDPPAPPRPEGRGGAVPRRPPGMLSPHPPGWWNGRHGALKMLCSQGRAGSSPALGTCAAADRSGRGPGSAPATRLSP